MFPPDWGRLLRRSLIVCRGPLLRLNLLATQEDATPERWKKGRVAENERFGRM